MAILTALLGGCAKPYAQAHSGAVDVDVGVVNSEVVEAREFAFFLLAERSKVYAYFQAKYGVEDSPAFWNQSFNGETPLEKITNDAWSKVVAAKVQQSLGVQAGFLQDTSYTVFLEQLQAENERRQADVRKSKPLYGPTQLGEKMYYDMRQSQLLEELRRKYSERKVVDDSDIANYYTENQRDFMKTGLTKVKMITASYSMTNEGTSRTNAENRLQEIAKRVTAGEDFMTVTDSYCRSQPTVFSCKERLFDGTTAKTDVMTNPALAAEAKQLDKDAMSAIIDEKQTLSLLQCLDKQADVLVPLDEVRKGIATKLNDQSFERFLQEQSSLARITRDEEALKSAASSVLLGK